MLKTVNPATGKLIKEYETLNNSEINQSIERTHQAFLAWKKTGFAHRAEILKKAAKNLLDNKKEYADIISQEMGKLNDVAMSEIEKCAWVCEYYAENAEAFLAPRPIKADYQKSYVSYQPSGVIFAIMPWNFPFWQVFRFAAPNLMAGHGCLLKHAEIVTGCALAIEECLTQAGFPKDLFQTLVISNNQAEQVIQNDHVTGVTLTGSERAGKAVASEAGANLKKVVLELGGCDPYIILEEADIEKAAEAATASRLNNSGQVCIAAKRLIVVDSVYDKFKKAVLKKLNVKIAPLAREDLRATVHKQVQEAIKQGAILERGGELPKGDGFDYPITVLENVAPSNIAFTDEIFGPVFTFIHASNETEAIDLANHSRFGLSAAVFTEDLKRGEAIVREKVHAGAVALNTFVASNPALPFGGIKHSGFGRELSEEGIRAFTNVKTIIIK